MNAGGSITNNTINGLYQLRGRTRSPAARTAGRSTPEQHHAGDGEKQSRATPFSDYGRVRPGRKRRRRRSLGNTVTGWGQNPFATNKIASNGGVLVAFGASAQVKGNTIREQLVHNRRDDTACGACSSTGRLGGVSGARRSPEIGRNIKKDNTITGKTEVDICDFGKDRQVHRVISPPRQLTHRKARSGGPSSFSDPRGRISEPSRCPPDVLLRKGPVTRMGPSGRPGAASGSKARRARSRRCERRYPYLHPARRLLGAAGPCFWLGIPASASPRCTGRTALIGLQHEGSRVSGRQLECRGLDRASVVRANNGSAVRP